LRRVWSLLRNILRSIAPWFTEVVIQAWWNFWKQWDNWIF
jgi:hypothetical protein